jgi:hypothetical protein
MKKHTQAILGSLLFAVLLSGSLYFFAGQGLKESLFVGLGASLLIYFLDLKPSKNPKVKRK